MYLIAYMEKILSTDDHEGTSFLYELVHVVANILVFCQYFLKIIII